MIKWTEAYEQFTEMVDKYFPDFEKVETEVEALYNEHKGEPAWDKAWEKWNESVDEE